MIHLFSIRKAIAFILCGIFILPIGSGVVIAGGNDKVEGIDRMKVAYRVPDNLEQLSETEIVELKKSHQTDLEELQEGALSREVAEEHMFDRLMNYCDVGLEIIDVIPALVEEYGIEGEYQTKLLTFRDTFKNDIAPIRDDVTNLKEFKSYDFRFKLAYLALLHAFHENPDVASKIERDTKDPDSTIGQFKQHMADAYEQLEIAQAEMKMMYTVGELQQVIVALDEELVRREK